MTAPLVHDPDFTLYVGDAHDVLQGLPDGSAQCCITSPPYLDARPDSPSPSLQQFEDIFRELARVVERAMFLNLGRIFRDRREVRWHEPVLLAAERAGWSHLDTRIWIKPNANPIHGEVFADKHEYVYVLGEPGALVNIDEARVPYAESSLARLKRGWTNHTVVKGDHSPRRSTEPHPLGGRPPSYMVVDTGREKGNKHPTPMPLLMAEALVALASWPDEIVLDPFAGSGTTNLAARRLGRRSIAIEKSPEWADGCAERLTQLSLLSGAAAS